MKKIISLFGNLVLMCISFLVIIVFAEIALRVFFPQIVVCKVDVDWQMKDDVLPWVLRPNVDERMTMNGQFDVKLTSNANGFRNMKDFSLEKPEGTKRIIVLGDSFVFGWGADDKEIFTDILNEKYNDEPDIGPVEVINAGVYGFNIDEYSEMFTRILKYDPDVVLLGFCLENDYNVKVKNEKGDIEDKEAEEWNDFGDIVRKQINNLHIIALIRDRLYITFPKIRSIMIALGINNKRDIFLKEYSGSLNNLLAGVSGKLEKMNDIAKKRGIEFIVALIPLKEQIYCRDAINKFDGYDVDSPNREVGSLLERSGIEYVDLLPGLIERSGTSKKRLYFDIDPHWTGEGHKAVAEILYITLKEKISQ